MHGHLHIQKKTYHGMTNQKHLKTFQDHVSNEVKELRKNRVFSGLRDASNGAARLVRVAERVRNRALKKSKAKPGDKKESDNKSHAEVPAGLKNLEMIWNDKERNIDDFQANLTQDCAAFWPGDGGNGFGSPVTLEVTQFGETTVAAKYYKKLNDWLHSYLQEQGVPQASSFLVLLFSFVFFVFKNKILFCLLSADNKKKKKNKDKQAASAIAVPSALEAVTAGRKTALPETLFSTPKFVGSEKVMTSIFEIQMTLGLSGSYAVGITDYGAGEIRVGLAGVELIAGYPYEKVAGTTLIEKSEHLKKMVKNEWQEATGGFRSVLKKGKLVGIPAGYMYATYVVSEEVACGLRWGCLNEQCRPACSVALAVTEEMRECTEGLKVDEVWTAWSKFLTAITSS